MPPPALPLASVRALRLRVARHRGLVAGGLAATAVLLALPALAPPAPATAAAVRLARDLAAGSVVTAADLHEVKVPADLRPEGAVVDVGSAVGRRLTSAVRRGELLTDVRVAGSALLDGQARGSVAVPVRLGDAAEASLLRPGDRIDVLATPTTGNGATVVVAGGVEVLAVPGGTDPGVDDGALVVVATTPDTAARLAAAAVSTRLSVAVRR